MNPIKLLTQTVDSLWLWTYGLVAGWGLMFTMVVVAVILLIVRQIRLERKISNLESRLVHAERDYNITLNQWKK
jgi:uncharacterized membrane protein YhiD involved in acid resistance